MPFESIVGEIVYKFLYEIDAVVFADASVDQSLPGRRFHVRRGERGRRGDGCDRASLPRMARRAPIMMRTAKSIRSVDNMI